MGTRGSWGYAARVLAALAVAILAPSCGGEEEDEEEAPPIPHEVTSTADGACLVCHREGTDGAPRSPHPSRADCVSCHDVPEGTAN